MHGNVYEWCLDWYSSINSDPVTDWVGASSGSFRVLRGGGWYYDDNRCRSTYRYSYGYPSDDYDYVGFRLSRTLNEE